MDSVSCDHILLRNHDRIGMQRIVEIDAGPERHVRGMQHAEWWEARGNLQRRTEWWCRPLGVR
jgi:hypothetical protein